MKVSEQLKQLRQQRAWNQEWVADQIHVSRQTISNWENDWTMPDLQSLLLLADLYHVTLDDLVRGELNDMEFKRTKRRLLGYSLGIVLGLVGFLLTLDLQIKDVWWWLLAIPSLTVQGYFSYKSLQLSRQKNIFTMAEISHYLKTGQIKTSSHRRARIIWESVGAGVIGVILGALIAWWWL